MDMDKEITQAKLYQHYLNFFLPEGILDFFDIVWMESMSPRTYLGCYGGPLFVSTCTNDFIRGQSILLKEDCEMSGRPVVFVDIQSENKKVGHVHNVTDQSLHESQEVNARMVAFMEGLL